jgi:hypothetical protein
MTINIGGKVVVITGASGVPSSHEAAWNAIGSFSLSKEHERRKHGTPKARRRLFTAKQTSPQSETRLS